VFLFALFSRRSVTGKPSRPGDGDLRRCFFVVSATLGSTDDFGKFAHLSPAGVHTL
jgi:hypothetical protein